MDVLIFLAPISPGEWHACIHLPSQKLNEIAAGNYFFAKKTSIAPHFASFHIASSGGPIQCDLGATVSTQVYTIIKLGYGTYVPIILGILEATLDQDFGGGLLIVKAVLNDVFC